MADTQAEIKMLEELRTLLLADFKRLAEAGELSPTDRRTLAGLLKDNGMQLDPKALPSHLRDKLSGSIPVNEGVEEEVDI